MRVSIALAAGMLSIMPSVFALPVHDDGGANHDGVRTAGTQISTSGNTMNITSTVRNNVIGWKDFSIASGETVQFDGGAKTNNYLNIVTGKTTATISGTLQGGKNVYIVSPNGVYFGKDANVNVGNLYVSTREGINIDSLATAANAANAAHTDLAPSAVLPQMSVTGAAFDSTGLYEDVVSVMDVSGKSLTADSVHIEGKRIRLLNSDRVMSAGGVHLFSDNTTDPNYGANGYIHIGNGTGTQNSQFSGDSNVPIDWYQLIYTKADWNAAAGTVNSKASVTTPDKNYMLAADIDFGTDSSFGSATMATFGDTQAHAFNGKFDGMFYTFQTNQGTSSNWDGKVFTYVNGLGTTHNQHARVDNFGYAGKTNTYSFGAIIGRAENADLRCLYIYAPYYAPNSFTFIGDLYSSTLDKSFLFSSPLGGDFYGSYGYFINNANNAKIRNSYSLNGMIRIWSRGGFIYSASNNTLIENSYTSLYHGSEDNYLVRVPDSTVQTKNCYISDYYKHTMIRIPDGAYSNSYHLPLVPWEGASDEMDKNSYAAWGDDISNEGGSHATWRIYQGRTQPLLRSLMQGGSIIADKFDYGYIARDGSYDAAAAHGTAVNGAAITKDAEGKNLVYNGKYMEILTTGNAKGGKNDVTFSHAADLSLIRDSADFNDRQFNAEPLVTTRPLDNYKGAINAGTTSLLFSSPLGYDIIGSNVTMEKKKPKIDEISKVWDKTSVAYMALKGALGNDKVSFTGDTSQFNAYMRVSGGNYYESDGTTLRSDVGKNLKIKDIAIALNGSYKMNYDIDLSDLRGSIVQRPIAVDIAYPTTSADMTYNGSAKLTQVAGDTHWTGMTAAVNLAENQQVTGNPDSGYVGGSAITWAHRDGRTDGATEAVYMRAGADSKDAGTYTKDADAGTGLVYRNFALAGADAKNYYVTDKTGRVLWQRPSDGVGETKDGLLYTSGKIWKKDLVGTHWTTAVSDQFGLYNKNSGAAIQAEKTYDGTSTVLSAKDNILRSNQIVHTTAGGNTTWDDITLTVTQADYIDANSLTASTAPDATDNGYAAHRAIAARYSVMPTGESVKNYTLNGVDLTAGTAVTNAITTAGRINRRTVKIKPLEIEKRYDGVANVVETDTSLLPSAIYGGNIGYLPFLKPDGTSAGYFDYASDDEKSHFLPADKVTINITGQFQATSDPTDGGANTVYYGAGGTATTPQQRNVQCSVSLHPDMSTGSPTWAKSGNYRLQSEGDTSAPGTVHDINAYFNVRTKGTILPARITNIKFQDIEKLYDGTNEVKGAQAINRPRIDKVTIEGQEVARGQNLTYGQSYGFYQENIFKSDGAGYVTQPHPTGFAGTYAQKDVKWNGTPGAAGSTVEQMDVTYRGLDKLLKNKNYVIEPSALTGKGKINPIRINPGGISGGIVADWNHIKKTYDATTDLSNDARSYLGGTGAGAFQVTDTSGQGTSLTLDDFNITGKYAAKNVGNQWVNLTFTPKDTKNVFVTGAVTQNAYGSITPREIEVSDFKNIRKTYDRNLTYTPSTADPLLKIGFLQKDITDGTVTYSATAVFDGSTTANASTMAGGVYNKDKTVNYTLAISGADVGNYKIMNGTTVVGNGSVIQKANQGTIEKRKVDVAIDAVTRDYNGTVIAAPTLAAGKVHLYSAGTTTADAAAAADGITGLDTSASSMLSGEFQNTDGTANKNAGTHKVKWSNITANVQGGGSLRDNYIFNDTYLGDGTITKLNLGTMTLNLKAGTITKTYDGTTAVKKDGTADENAWRSLLNRIDVTTGLGTSVLSPDDYSITAASYDSKNISTGGAGFTKTVNYTIKLNDAQNYTVTGFNAAGERTLSQANMGEVKPLEVQVQFNDISKSYDSTLTYTPPAGTKPVAVDFFTGDAVTLTSSADFDGATTANASTMTGGVYNKDKTVNYTVNFTGTDAANYKVMDGTTPLAPGTAVTRTKTNKGTIERRRLDIAIDPVTRAFDDTAAAASTLAAGKTHLYAHSTQTADAIATADGIGVDTSAASALRGEFRDGTTPNSNAGTHDVHWRNLKNILTGAAAGNYDVNADYTGAGTITKLNIDGITSLGLNGTARKVYDGDTVLRDNAGTATDVAWKSFISDTTGLSFGTLTRDKTSYTVMGADYDGADVATGRDLTYKIKLHDAGNYQSAHLDAAGVFTVTNMGAGEITRRELRYQLTHPNLTKEYDGTTTAKWNGASVAGDEAVTFTNWAPHSAAEDAITNKNRSTAVYTDKNAGTGKTVNYTLAFAPGLNMANYTIVDAADAAHTPHAPGSIVTGAGEIARKNLNLTVSNEVTKVYDGKKAWTNGMTGDSVTLHTGDIVTGDSVNLSNSYQMGSAFNSKNVADAKTFTYDDIRLSGADAANYTLQGRYADGSAAAVSENPGGSFKIITKGRIIPKLLDVALDNAAIHKEYDGTKLVADRAGAGTHFSTVENITTPTAHSYRRDAEGKAQSLDIAGVTGDDGAETLHVSLANRAPEYDDSNVRYDANSVPESMPVTYWLRWDDANYRLAGVAGWTLTGAQQGELKTAGTILPKEVTASISGTIWKTYDGTLDMGDAAGRAMHNIRFTGLTVPGETDAAILGGAVVGGHFNGDPDAATSETQDYDPTGHSFDYTVGITNRNYRLAGAAADGTVQINGAAEIHRKEIYAKPDTPAPIRQGEPAPEHYTGHVEGLLPADDTPANQARFTYGLAPGVTLDTDNVGSYPIHGYYNGRTEGNFLKNYRFSSVPAQMNVLMNAPERDYDDALAPFRKFRPDDHAYQFASFDDDNVASFYRKPSAALNYEGDGTRIPDKTAG